MRNYQTQIGIALAVFIASLDTSITNTLIPNIAITFGIEQNIGVLSILLYQLIMIAFTIPLMNYGKKYGLNKILYAGILCFAFHSIIVSFAHNYAFFIYGRIGQALGATAILGSYNAIIKLVIQKKDIGKWIGIFTLTIASGLSIGPSLASFLIKYIPWNFIFLMNIPLMMFAFLLIYQRIPNNKILNFGFDWITNILIIFAFILFILGINFIHQDDYNIQSIISLFLSFILFIILYIKNNKLDNSNFPFHLLSNSNYVIPLLSTAIVFIIQSIAYVGIPIILYSQFKIPLYKIGYLISPWPLMGAITAPVAGYFSDKYSSIKLSIIGLIILGIGAYVVTISFPDNQNKYFIYAMMLCGLGFGFFQTPNIKSVMNFVNEKDSGNASGLLAIFRVIGQSFGSILVAYFILHFNVSEWKLLFYAAILCTVLGSLILSIKLVTK